MSIDALLGHRQYSLAQEEKQAILTKRLRALTQLHVERCEPYGRILRGLGCDTGAIGSLDALPMIPVGLFKSHALRSIADDRVFKVVTSSGTTGAAVSRIYLDAAAAQLQTRALAGIMTHWLGAARMPMIVVDARSTLANRRTFAARGAGIIGMTTFGRDHFYALDDDMLYKVRRQ